MNRILTGALVALSLGACAQAPALAPRPLEPGPGYRLQALSPLTPTPVSLISRSDGVVGTSRNLIAATDGIARTYWTPSAKRPVFIALPLQRPAANPLLVRWDAVGYYYATVPAAPRSYDILASSDSTDGVNGSWILVKRVQDTPVRSRLDQVSAPGARWIKLVFPDKYGNGPLLREIAVYEANEASPSRLDAWTILGDSITGAAFDPKLENAFPEEVAARAPGFRPLLIGAGTGGEEASDGLRKLDLALDLFPPGSFVGLAYGTNDVNHGVPIDTFKAKLQQLIDRIRASGREPMLARMPFTRNQRIPPYLAVIDELVAQNRLAPGPDLYTWFRDHKEEQKGDRVHPNAKGIRSIQRLWAEAVAHAYGF